MQNKTHIKLNPPKHEKTARRTGLNLRLLPKSKQKCLLLSLSLLTLTLSVPLLQAAPIPGTSLTPTVWWTAGAANNVKDVNGIVSQLTDQSGNANNAVQDSGLPMPLIVSNVVNGLPALSFGGTNLLTSLTGAATGNSSHSIFIVASYVVGNGGFRNGAVAYSDAAGANVNSCLGVDPNTSHVWVGGWGQDNSPYVGTINLNGAGFNILGKIYDGPTHTYQGLVAGTRDVNASLGTATYNLGNAHVGIGRQFNNGSYWTGDIAEVIVFNTALGYYDAIGVQQYLANKYNLPLTIALPTLSMNSPQLFQDVGSNVLVSVSLPPNFSLSNSITITITNDNTSVVGFTATNLVFTVGGTNSQTFAAPILAPGTANLSANTAGFDGATLAIGGVLGRSISEKFLASDPAAFNGGTVNNTDPVNTWAGETNTSAVMNFGGVGNDAIYQTIATPAGTPAVTFSNGSYFVAGASSPITNQNFSVAVVFQANAPGTGAFSSQWYTQQGILDAKTAIDPDNDWGISLSSSGTVGFGLGNPDTTVNSTNNYNVVNPLYHIVVASADTMNGQLSLTLDNMPTVTSSATYNGTLRGLYDITVGGSSVENLNNFFDGQIAEIRFYNGALTVSEATNLVATLKTQYSVKYASEVVMSLTPAAVTMDLGKTNAFTLTLPVGFNAHQPVTVTVTNSGPSTVSFLGAVGSTLAITFPAGATNVQTLRVKSLAAGSANLSYGSPGLTPAGTTVISVIPGAPTQIPVTGGGSGGGFAPLPGYVSAVDLGGGPTVIIQGISFNAVNATGNYRGKYNYGKSAAGYGFGNTTDDINMAAMLTGFTYCYSANVTWDGAATTNDATYLFTGLDPAKTYQVDVFTVADGGVPRSMILQAAGATTNTVEVAEELTPKICEYVLAPDATGNIAINWGRGTDAGLISGIAVTTQLPPVLSVQSTTPGSMTITWIGAATLYQAASVTGPWVPVASNPGSPYIAPTTNSSMFYQLR